MAAFYGDAVGQYRTVGDLRVNWWFILLIAAAFALPLWYVHFLGLIRLQHRPRRGLCLSCIYDLRASFDRCPECGINCPPRRKPVVG